MLLAREVRATSVSIATIGFDTKGGLLQASGMSVEPSPPSCLGESTTYDSIAADGSDPEEAELPGTMEGLGSNDIIS